MRIDLFDLGWNALIFWIAVGVTALLALRPSRVSVGRFNSAGRALPTYLFGLVWYLGTVWIVTEHWEWFGTVMFWLLWLTPVVIAISFLTGKLIGLARGMAIFFAIGSVCLAMLGAPSRNELSVGNTDVSTLIANFTKQQAATNATVAAIQAKDVEQDKRLAAIEEVNRTQNGRLDQLEKDVAALKGQMTKVKAGLAAAIKDGKVYNGSADDTSPETIGKALGKAFAPYNWKPGMSSVGTIDRDANVVDGQEHAFGQGNMTRQKITEFLNGHSTASKAAKAHILASTPESEHARILSGKGYVSWQPHVNYCMDGNGLLINGKFEEGNPLCHRAGDVLWIYISKDGTIYWEATLRDDCLNAGMNQAPAPRGTEQSTICAKDTDRKGQMKGNRPCNNRPATPTPSRTTPDTGTPTPSNSTPPTSTPTTSPPRTTTSRPPRTTTSTPSCTSGNGTYGCGKTSAPQPSGVEKPTQTVAPTAEPSPTPKVTPLTPSSTATQSPTSGSGDGHTPSTSVPVVGGTATNTGGPAGDG